MKSISEKGFSLVEMIIVMIITLVLATIVVTVYITQAREVRESMVYARIQRGHDLFLEQFGRDVRFASMVLDATDPNEDGEDLPYLEGTTKRVDIYGMDSIITYSIENNIVTRDARQVGQNPPTGELTEFDIGGGDVLIINSETSNFYLNPRRDRGAVELEFVDINLEDVTFALRKDLFKCRN